MLDLLEQYAVRKGLVVEPGFKAKTARRIIELDKNGKFLQVFSPTEKNADFTFDRCPELTQPELIALGESAPPLLSECSTVALLTDKAENEPDAKQKAKHQFFVERMKEVAAVDSTFQPVVTALTNENIVEQIQSELRKVKAKATDKTTFLIGDEYPINSEGWWDWWRTRRAELISGAMSKGAKPATDAEDAEQMVCLVTGTPTVPLRVHPKLTGLGDVGGQAQVPFLGFDKEAFRSYGLEKSANAAVSENAAYAYRAALDDLLKRSEKITGMRVAHWFSGYYRDEDAPVNDNDPIYLVFTGKTSTEQNALMQARTLLQRVRKGGSETGEAADYVYYALSLTGAGGRVMVRDWMTGSFANLAKSVATWFEDLSITTLDGSDAPSPPLWRVISCALSPDESGDKGVGAIKIPLWKAALDSSRPIPDAAVNRILALHRTFIVTGELDNAKRKTPLSTLYIRMGVLKASLIRKGIPMSPQLDSEKIAKLPHKHKVAFQCGRLIAMLAELQQKAIPGVDAGIAQRYYGAASTTPSLVIGRLVKLSQHHVAKLRGDQQTKGLSFWFEANIGEIIRGMNNDGEPADLPKTFTPEQQTLFALGYYQQIAENRTKKSDKPDAPPAEADPAPTETDAPSTDAE